LTFWNARQESTAKKINNKIKYYMARLITLALDPGSKNFDKDVL
jgi:hypothetical protein